ncbi:hypothetical protein EVAR_15915_1 [Eumeta japonica]|uniref:Uncharacterized protein n=1 Tax=Eumeta variegata TaxID=151549 RepID=A0A4C1UMD1_EUMVA|nr:hypothetical protein EVAR_15915_1 [Eumeta japonica]
MNTRDPGVITDALPASREKIECVMEAIGLDGKGEGRADHRNFHSPDETIQQKQLLHVRILRECVVARLRRLASLVHRMTVGSRFVPTAPISSRDMAH